VRWLKFYFTDLDSPAFAAGIDKFGPRFVHDVIQVWKTLSVEDGPGLRELPVSDDTLNWLTKRVSLTDPGELNSLLQFMADWRLIEMKPGRARDGSGRHRGGSRLHRDGSGLHFIVSCVNFNGAVTNGVNVRLMKKGGKHQSRLPSGSRVTRANLPPKSQSQRSEVRIRVQKLT
jgi:hypothetical protein